jgi:NAD(P)-dependent dehydrogenase (short-subunit alcohol dehydrogenase family)
MVQAFATHTKGNANIIILGRNRVAAEEIISKFPKPTVDGVKHEFVECDVSLMKTVKETTAKLLERYPKVNFVAITPGIMTFAGRTETSEGIDKKMAIHYYGRWKFIQGLLDGLKAAKAAGEDAKVTSVLAAGKGGAVDMKDLPLKDTFTVSKAALVAPTYNDLMMEVNIFTRVSLPFLILFIFIKFSGTFHPPSRDHIYSFVSGFCQNPSCC